MEYYLISGTRRLTLHEFHRNSKKIAQGLTELGVTEGDSVALLLRNGIEFLETTFAAGLIGAYPVPINWHFKRSEIEYIIDNSDAEVIVVHADLTSNLPSSNLQKLKPLVVPTPPELQFAYGLTPEQCMPNRTSPNWDTWSQKLRPWSEIPASSRGSMIYTSGTTGQPKGVRREPVPAALQQSMLERARIGFGLQPGARALMTGPLYHSAPNAYARTVIALGGDLILMPRFDATEFLAEVEKHSITHVHMVPTMFVRLLNLPAIERRKYDLQSLESVVHGAAPCAPTVKHRMIEWWGPIINEYYGSTEAGLVTYVNSKEWIHKVGTVGRPISDSIIQIHDGAGNLLAPGEIGDIFVNLPNSGGFTYHKDEPKRIEISRGNLITNGDCGYLDKDNYLYLTDRKSDMVISAGVNIYPAEIEKTLMELGGIKDCAVFGIPDSEYGEALVVAIEPKSDNNLTERLVQDFLRNNMAGYKVPKFVTFLDRLPREDSGKLFKRRLRETYLKRKGR